MDVLDSLPTSCVVTRADHADVGYSRAGSPDSEASSDTLDGLTCVASQETSLDSGDGGYGNSLSHWCVVSACSPADRPFYWCRRLFVVQWSLDCSVILDSFWSLMSVSIAPFLEKHWGMRAPDPQDRKMQLYRFIVLLSPAAVDAFAALVDFEELFPDPVEEIAGVGHSDYYLCPAPCGRGQRMQFLSTWTLSTCSLASVLTGDQFVWSDVFRVS